MSLLAIDNLQVRYGQVTGVNGLSLEVNESETVALVGSNGAGKMLDHICVVVAVPQSGDEPYVDHNSTCDGLANQ